MGLGAKKKIFRKIQKIALLTLRARKQRFNSNQKKVHLINLKFLEFSQKMGHCASLLPDHLTVTGSKLQFICFLGLVTMTCAMPSN